MKKEIILTSEVKKGDVFQTGGHPDKPTMRTAQTDAYYCLETGCWSVDICSEFRYGWEGIERAIR